MPASFKFGGVFFQVSSVLPFPEASTSSSTSKCASNTIDHLLLSSFREVAVFSSVFLTAQAAIFISGIHLRQIEPDKLPFNPFSDPVRTLLLGDLKGATKAGVKGGLPVLVSHPCQGHRRYPQWYVARVKDPTCPNMLRSHRDNGYPRLQHAHTCSFPLVLSRARSLSLRPQVPPSIFHPKLDHWEMSLPPIHSSGLCLPPQCFGPA
jgi:hypothetical protein